MRDDDDEARSDVDDADAAISLIDIWLECRHWLSEAEPLAPELVRSLPRTEPWLTVERHAERVLELLEHFDKLGLEIFEAGVTERRELMLQIGGSLRVEIVDRTALLGTAIQNALQRWGGGSSDAA